MSAGLAAFLKTRVARRLFMFFIMAAFLPLAAIAVLSFTQVRSLLLQQGDQRIAAMAKAYGMGVFERMTLAAEVAASGRDDALAKRIFRTLDIVSGGLDSGAREAASLPTVPGEARGRIDAGKPAAFVVTGSGPPRVYVASITERNGIGIGEVDGRFLWGPADEMPAATEYCVVEEGSGTLLHCHAPGGERALQAFASEPSITARAARWSRDGESHRARAWGQFMRAGFGSPDWIVVASQPEHFYTERLAQFSRTYVPVVILALLLVTWLTVRQSRHIVEPVGALTRRARSIADNDFESKVEVDRDDEFGELASAFDRMSGRLGRQFASLKTLSEIDKLILTTQDTTQVVRTVLNRLGAFVSAPVVTLTLFEQGEPGHARTYHVIHGAMGGFLVSPHPAASEDQDSLQSGGSHEVRIADGAAQSYLRQAKELGMSLAHVQPIAWRGSVCGALVLAYPEGAMPDEEDRLRARELADRVAVAVSSARRDEQLYLQAHFDPLTGAPNRLLFRDRLGLEIARSRREGQVFAILFIDLDHFKGVNDTFGHSMGDLVLREAAARIGSCVRASDTVSRLGGDEFTVMLTNLSHAQEAWLIAESVIDALSQEFSIGGRQCFLSASIGISSYPTDGATAEELLKCADTAMYRAKAGGRAQAVFFEERMNAEAVARLTLDTDLRAAIERGELVMHYQPQVDLATGMVCAAEALVRWRHPTRGLIPPARFIRLAEESGFIERLGKWALETSCAQMAAWRAAGLSLEHVAVNVSPRQFRKRDFVEIVGRSVVDAGLPASCLEIEITEGLLLESGASVEAMLQALARAGHGIALDDFGTGFSSMSYLKRFPVTTIKIDRAFVEGLGLEDDSEAIVAAIIAMSHALGKKVIAEGVETLEQAAVLRRLGCDRIQGFVICAALAAEDFASFVGNRVKSAIIGDESFHL